jgi:hypothetical protein
LLKLQDWQNEIGRRLSRIEKLTARTPAVGVGSGRKLGRKRARKKRGRPLKKVTAKRGRKPGRKPGKKSKKTCKIKGCKKPAVAKGLCANHYQQMRRKARKGKIVS